MSLPHSDRFSKLAGAFLVAAAALSLSTVASAQTVYTETFPASTGPGVPYVPGETLSDQGGWTTNDEGTGGTYTYSGNTGGFIGQSDGVNVIPNVSTSSTDEVGFLGGAYGKAVAPGRSDVTLTHTLPASTAQTVNFSTDFLVTGPTTTNANHDTFGFAFTGGATNSTLFSVNFSLQTTTSGTTTTVNPDSDNITYTAGGTTTTTPYAISLLTQRYKLTVNVNVTVGTFSAFYQAEDQNGALTGAQATLVSGATYALAGTGNVTGYGALWSLTSTSTTGANNPMTAGTNNTAYINAGTNALYFDNVLVSVPEPSTYAMLGVGVLGLAFAARRARAA